MSLFESYDPTARLTRNALASLSLTQITKLTGYTQWSKANCLADPVLASWLKEHKFEDGFSAADYMVLYELEADLKSSNTLGLDNLLEKVTQMHGSLEWSLEKVTYKLPNAEPVERKNVPVPTVEPTTRPGSLTLRTFVCQFFDVQKTQLVTVHPSRELDLAFGSKKSPINPAGVKALLVSLRKSLGESPEFKVLITKCPTLSGSAFWDLVARWMANMPWLDYFMMHHSLITTALRGFSYQPSKGPLRTLMKPASADGADLCIEMTKKMADNLGLSDVFKRWCAKMKCLPVVFIGGMTPYVDMPKTATAENFFPLLKVVDLVLGRKRGLGPVVKCANHMPLMSSELREANTFTALVKIALAEGQTVIDVVVSSLNVVRLMKSVLSEQVDKKIVQFVCLARVKPMQDPEPGVGPTRSEAFLIGDFTKDIEAPSAKKDSSTYYIAKANEYVERLPDKGLYLATVFRPEVFDHAKAVYSFPYALRGVAVLSTLKIKSDIDPFEFMKDWDSWVAKSLKDPKRILLQAVCPSIIGSKLANYVNLSKLTVKESSDALNDYVYANRDDSDWADLPDDVEEHTANDDVSADDASVEGSDEVEEDVPLQKPKKNDAVQAAEKTNKKKKKQRQQQQESSSSESSVEDEDSSDDDDKMDAWTALGQRG